MSLVVDTSTLVAIVTGEPGEDWLAGELRAARGAVISAPSALELGMVLEGRRPDAVDPGRRAIVDGRLTIESFDEDLTERALTAFRRFGKGRHPAALNFGDCCTYALAERTGWPILCAGDDFARTDLPVLRPPL